MGHGGGGQRGVEALSYPYPYARSAWTQPRTRHDINLTLASRATAEELDSVPTDLVRRGVTFLLVYNYLATFLFCLIATVLMKNGLKVFSGKRFMPVFTVLGIAIVLSLLSSCMNSVFWASQLLHRTDRATLDAYWLVSTTLIFFVPIVTQTALTIRMYALLPPMLVSTRRRVLLLTTPVLLKVLRIVVISVAMASTYRVIKTRNIFPLDALYVPRTWAFIIAELWLAFFDSAYATVFLLGVFLRSGRRNDSSLLVPASGWFSGWLRLGVYACMFSFLLPTCFSLALALAISVRVDEIVFGYLLIVNVILQNIGGVLGTLSSQHKWRNSRYSTSGSAQTPTAPSSLTSRFYPHHPPRTGSDAGVSIMTGWDTAAPAEKGYPSHHASDLMRRHEEDVEAADASLPPQPRSHSEGGNVGCDAEGGPAIRRDSWPYGHGVIVLPPGVVPPAIPVDAPSMMDGHKSTEPTSDRRRGTLQRIHHLLRSHHSDESSPTHSQNDPGSRNRSPSTSTASRLRATMSKQRRPSFLRGPSSLDVFTTSFLFAGGTSSAGAGLDDHDGGRGPAERERSDGDGRPGSPARSSERGAGVGLGLSGSSGEGGEDSRSGSAPARGGGGGASHRQRFVSFDAGHAPVLEERPSGAEPSSMSSSSSNSSHGTATPSPPQQPTTTFSDPFGRGPGPGRGSTAAASSSSSSSSMTTKRQISFVPLPGSAEETAQAAGGRYAASRSRGNVGGAPPGAGGGGHSPRSGTSARMGSIGAGRGTMRREVPSAMAESSRSSSSARPRSASGSGLGLGSGWGSGWGSGCHVRCACGRLVDVDADVLPASSSRLSISPRGTTMGADLAPMPEGAVGAGGVGRGVVARPRRPTLGDVAKRRSSMSDAWSRQGLKDDQGARHQGQAQARIEVRGSLPWTDVQERQGTEQGLMLEGMHSDAKADVDAEDDENEEERQQWQRRQRQTLVASPSAPVWKEKDDVLSEAGLGAVAALASPVQEAVGWSSRKSSLATGAGPTLMDEEENARRPPLLPPASPASQGSERRRSSDATLC